MSSLPVFVGLDYHQGLVQVCVLNAAGKVLANTKAPDSAAAIDAIVSRHGQVSGAGVEACCGAANLADELSQRFQWPISLCHPGYASRMKHNPDKHDLGDARLIADLVRVGYLPKVWLAPEELRTLRRLVRYRQQLVDARRNVKLRIRALLRDHRVPSPGVNPWTKRWLAWLELVPLPGDDRWLLEQHVTELLRLTCLIRNMETKLLKRAEHDAVTQKLMTMAGVGLVTATTLRAEIGRFDRFRNGKELARYCGVTPRNASSGNRQADAGLIRAGNPQLRMVLIELAQRLTWRLSPQWSGLILRLRKNGKKKNEIVAAVANRWTRWLFHQMQPAALAA